jgi:NtrC-family two-component system sensor histidine kinase KinB
MLAMLVSSNQQMLSLVNVLLEVYRYEAKQQRLIMEDIQLANIVQSVVMELHGLAKAKEQTLETTIQEPLPLVYGDKQAIRRVLTNVIANAHNHTSKGSHITVSADVRDDTVVICVKDNGRGIPANDLKKLFQRFSQGTSKHRNTGTGLGLYLCKQIVDAHGGSIWAESNEGEGCCFYVELRQFSHKAIADMARVESQQLGVKLTVE